MKNLVSNEISEMQSIKQKIHQLGMKGQLDLIKDSSPYSDKITPYIRMYNELRLYYTLHLRESNITRPCIIKEIDFDLWVSSEGCTNLDLMLRGNAPYAFDAPEGKVELHHIGQDYSAPFAELTLEEHSVNGQLLHTLHRDSWRNNKHLEKAFYAERASHWKKRALQNNIVSDYVFEELKVHPIRKQQEYLAELRETCEEIYSQCNIEDLEYLSDLAKSFAMMQRIGAETMHDFLKNSREAHQTNISCPVCKSPNYVYFGSYQGQGEKIQRYKCKFCGKVFTPIQKSLVSGSTFSFRDWIKFIDCLYNGYTLKQIAKICDISEKTAHENRMRVFYAMKLLNDKVRLQGNVVIDETYIPVSYKGNHSKQEGFVMPRESYKRGGENHVKGISHNLACVVCAVDDSRQSVAVVAGTGNVSAAKLHYVLDQHLDKNIQCIYSDKSAAIKKFAETGSHEIKQEKLFRKGTQKAKIKEISGNAFVINRYLQIINGYHSRLKRFLHRFSGISTKHLSGYLYLFSWKERNRDTDLADAYRELLSVMTEPNNYLSIDEISENGCLPNAVRLNEVYRKGVHVNIEQHKEIYRRYAAGETMASIARNYGCTRQNISAIIQHLRKRGYAYKTEKDKAQEQRKNRVTSELISRARPNNLERDYQIYYERQQWTKTSNEFLEAMSPKYGLSKQRIKNIIAEIHRVEQLKSEIFIHEDVSYRSLKEVYQSIYVDYQHLLENTPDISSLDCEKLLADRHGFSYQNIDRIIRIMSGSDTEQYFIHKRKLTSQETYNRDKAIFVDFLRWEGNIKDFCSIASEKYGLSSHYIRTILRYCLFANPERYNLV